MKKDLTEKIPKLVQGHFKIELIDEKTGEILKKHEDNNKILIWVYRYFAESVFGLNPPDIDDFRIQAFSLGTSGEYPLGGGTKPIDINQEQLFSEYNFWNDDLIPPEESYVYQVTFDKPSSENFEYVQKLNEGATWPHQNGIPLNYRGTPLNYEDELEAGVSIKRGFSNGILSQEIYIGKLAGNGHPAWGSTVTYSEAALYMPLGKTDKGDSLGTIFSMKTFPGMPKSESCVIRIQWDLDFNL